DRLDVDQTAAEAYLPEPRLQLGCGLDITLNRGGRREGVRLSHVPDPLPADVTSGFDRAHSHAGHLLEIGEAEKEEDDEGQHYDQLGDRLAARPPQLIQRPGGFRFGSEPIHRYPRTGARAAPPRRD